MKTRKHLVFAKIKSYYSLIAVTVIFTACSNNDLDAPEGKQSVKTVDVALKETSLEALGYKSIDEMYQDGWVNEKIDDTRKSSKDQIENNQSKTGKFQTKPAIGLHVMKSKAPETIKEKVTPENIEQLNLGYNKIKNIYKMSGYTPGVTINSWKSPGTYLHNNLADDYGWYAYIQTGKPTVTTKYLNLDDGYILSSFAVINQSNQDDSFNRTFSYTRSKTSSWNVTVTAGVTVKGEIGVPFLANGSVEVSLSASAGGGGSTTTTYAETYSYIGKIPAHSKRIIIVRQKKIKSKSAYTIPVNFTGLVALNFPETVNKPYFWSIHAPADKLQQGKNKAQLGSVSIDEVLGIEIIAGPVQPI